MTLKKILKIIVTTPLVLSFWLGSDALAQSSVGLDQIFGSGNTNQSLGSGKDKGIGKGEHASEEKCMFNDVNDMIRKVNRKAIQYAQSLGQPRSAYDGNGNGNYDALESVYYGEQSHLGSYKCSEFSAVLACILQELFNCSSEQVRVIEGHVRPGLRHSINQLNRNMFNRPPAQGDAEGWFNFEPQAFFSGGKAGGTNSINYNKVVYDKPQPYRSGVNNTIYDELGCKSGPGYSGGGGEGPFGGLGGSLLLTSLLNSLMSGLNQEETPTPVTTLTPDETVTPSPEETETPTPTPTVSPKSTISLFSTPIPVGREADKNSQIPTPSPYKLDAMKVPEESDSIFGESTARKSKLQDHNDGEHDADGHNHHGGHDHNKHNPSADKGEIMGRANLSSSSPLSGESAQLFP